jgi:hypothetical protein
VELGPEWVDQQAKELEQQLEEMLDPSPAEAAALEEELGEEEDEDDGDGEDEDEDEEEEEEEEEDIGTPLGQNGEEEEEETEDDYYKDEHPSMKAANFRRKAEFTFVVSRN